MEIEGAIALSSQFELLGSYPRRHVLWAPGESHQNLYFNTTGTLAEYREINGKNICHQIIPPMSLFWSVPSFILQENTDSTLSFLDGSQVYILRGDSIRNITQRFQLDFILANSLSTKNILKYEERINDLCRLDPGERLNKTLAKNPNILFQLTRVDLAAYLNISRSTLFRTLNSLHRGN